MRLHRIRDMKQGNFDCAGNRGGQLVHGVRAQDNEVGAPVFKLLCCLRQHGAEPIPVPVMLQALQLGKIARQYETSRVVLAPSLRLVP